MYFTTPMSDQPAPASTGEESEEDQQFLSIFQQIAGDVSTGEPLSAGGSVSMVVGWGRSLAMPVVTVVTAISWQFSVGVINTTPDLLFILVSYSKWRSPPMTSKMSWTKWCLNVRIFVDYYIVWLWFFYTMSSRNDLLFTDKDIHTEGFSRESCRSMIALMDVSFVSRLHDFWKAPF